MSRVPFQLLELSILSAQDLAPAIKNLSKNLKTYAVTWVNPDRKLRTRPDPKGGNNPHWNQKFIFRVEDKLLDSDSASVVVEIYTIGWLKDTLVGSVSVLLRDLIPSAARRDRRVVALQVRRPHSGRPQGILSMGVALLDNTMKSMPLCAAFAGAPAGTAAGGGDATGEKRKLVRTLSDQTDLSKMVPGERKRKRGGSVCSVATGYGGGSVVNPAVGGEGGGSMLNGSEVSDLGPSPSVVAIAVAHGLYPLQQRPAPKKGGSVLEDWTVEEESSVEDLQTKLEQWRLEQHQGYQRLGGDGKSSKRQKKRDHRRSRSVGGGEGDGRFSCFGNACGCEFTIAYGGGGRKNRRRDSASSKCSDSEL
ncbi:uncharacterized protein LOC131017377 [Salvia miltiorrhiza]|uniref:uncharacterized protein LOC131017377 n=1 Tax=Salvia miltiorrhiza TaxID=226208 RepID=UPI0025ACC62B|nr:uncharacterized protein LOC131017377 [Salvia miltiorrhiza]